MRADLNRLVERPAADQRLDPAETPPPIREATGLSDAASSSGSSAGIASPLTEAAIATRTYHDAVVVSSDGLFAWPAVASMSFTDASGNAVVINFSAPA